VRPAPVTATTLARNAKLLSRGSDDLVNL